MEKASLTSKRYPSRKEILFIVLYTIFISILITTNIIGRKSIWIFNLSIYASVLIYPFTYVISNAVNEIFGSERATQLIRLGVILNILVWLILWIVKKLPYHPESPIDRHTFEEVFDYGHIFVITSIVVYYLSQYLNVKLFSWLRTRISSRLEKGDLIPKVDVTYSILLGIFITVLLLTNSITAKYFRIFGISMTAGVITYPITFLITDIITEIYGRKRATIAVWMGFLASIIMMMIIIIMGGLESLPVDDGTHSSQRGLKTLFGYTPGIILGSMTAYLVSQMTDVYIYDSIKRFTRGKHLWIRNNAATIISELIDTIVFAVVAWFIWPQINPSETTPIISLKVWSGIALAEYVFKVIFALVDTPVLYFSIYVINKFRSTKLNSTRSSRVRKQPHYDQ